MARETRVVFEPVRTIAFGAITPGYVGIGDPFSRPVRWILIQNLTDKNLMFSFNGVDDHFPLCAQGYLLSDWASNKLTSDGFYIPENTRIYVKQMGVPASGAVYVTVT